MKQVAKVLGLIGGIGGAVLSALILFVVWVRQFSGRARFGERLAAGVSGWGVFVLLFAILGIIGAAMVNSKPRSGGILMLVSGGGGILAIIVSSLISGRFSGIDLVEAVFAVLLIASGILGTTSPANKAKAHS